MFPEDVAQVLDGGRAFNGGNPPAEVSFNGAHVPNPQKDAPPQTILGAEQKAWFKDQLRNSTATWKIWGNSEGALDARADPQNLPPGLTKEAVAEPAMPRSAPAITARAYSERAEIYDLVRDAKITGFAIVSGDRHSFWAGYATSRTAARQVRASGPELRRRLAVERRNHGSLRAQSAQKTFRCGRCSSPIGRIGAKPDWTYNMLLKHGVRSCLEYAKSFDLERARAAVEPATFARTSNSSILAGMAMRRFGSPATRCGPSSSASRGPSRAATAPTAGRFATASSHTAKLWGAGRAAAARSAGPRRRHRTVHLASRSRERRAGTGRRCASRRRSLAGC